jgi:hypothetical protein
MTEDTARKEFEAWALRWGNRNYAAFSEAYALGRSAMAQEAAQASDSIRKSLVEALEGVSACIPFLHSAIRMIQFQDYDKGEIDKRVGIALQAKSKAETALKLERGGK